MIVISAKNREASSGFLLTGSAYKTQLNERGEWKTVTHQGVQYSIALVRPTFSTPMVRAALPAIGGEVLDMVTVLVRAGEAKMKRPLTPATIPPIASTGNSAAERC